MRGISSTPRGYSLELPISCTGAVQIFLENQLNIRRPSAFVESPAMLIDDIWSGMAVGKATGTEGLLQNNKPSSMKKKGALKHWEAGT
jgi:hypothetical protein